MTDNGSSPAIPLSAPDIGILEQEYVLAAMRTGWAAPVGPDLATFETEVASYAGVAHAVGLSSGTAALHLGLLALGVGPGDVVLTSTLTFAATAFAIRYCGASPVFIDCHPGSGNLDPDLLGGALRTLTARRAPVAAVIPVDLFGKPADYHRILPIAAEFGVPVLADAAESFGASRDGAFAGSFGDASAVSFNGNKIMTTSGGGMLLSNNAEITELARHLASQARQPVSHYQHNEIGFNYRLSNILAALGRAQLTRLDSMIDRRRRIRERYRKAFASAPGVAILGGSGDAQDNAWLTVIVVEETVTGWPVSELRSWLGTCGIETRPVWKPMHLQPVFSRHEAYLNGSAERLYRTGLALPSGSGMDESDVGRIEEAIEAFLELRPAVRPGVPTHVFGGRG